LVAAPKRRYLAGSFVCRFPKRQGQASALPSERFFHSTLDSNIEYELSYDHFMINLDSRTATRTLLSAACL
jgi:hypothetical protein